MHSLPKSKENQGLPALFRAETANVPITGYLFSLDSRPSVYRYQPETQEPIFRREDKPRWRIDVCAALPEGGASR